MAETRLVLEIEGMTCAGCAETIRHSIVHAIGVSEARVSWKQGVAEVIYDPDQTDEEQIVEGALRRPYRVRRKPDGGCC